MNCNIYELIISVLIAISIGLTTLTLTYFKTKKLEDIEIEVQYRI